MRLNLDAIKNYKSKMHLNVSDTFFHPMDLMFVMKINLLLKKFLIAYYRSVCFHLRIYSLINQQKELNTQ